MAWDQESKAKKKRVELRDHRPDHKPWDRDH